MARSDATVAEQVARAASAFAAQTTGHAPRSVTAVLSGDALVLTLQGALSPAEQTLARSPSGAAQVQEFHRQLFASAAGALRQEIERITGVEVHAASAQAEPATGTVVQVFLLARAVATDTWSGVA